MTREEIRKALAAPFAPDVVKFKAQTVKDNRALAVAFIDARDVAARLDDVLGIDGWEEAYRTEPSGNVVCTLTVYVGERRVNREDIGGPSDQKNTGDKAKAAFSDAFKRAAVKFGVGRYIYRLPKSWVGYDPQKKQLTEKPQFPAWAVPDDFKAAGPKLADTVAKLALAYCNEAKRNVADYTSGLLSQLGYKDPAKVSVATIQLRHANAMMRKINADIEEWATGKLPDGYPKTGAELHKRVTAKDTELAKLHPKHVAVGSLVASVVEAGTKSGLPSDLTKWEGNKAMRLGTDAVSAFLAALNVKTGQQKAEEPQKADPTDGRTDPQEEGGEGDYGGDDYGGEDYT